MIDLDQVTRTMSPKQIRSIVESASVRIALWAGAVRSGKTIASLLAFLIALAAAPDQGLVLICGKTLQSIERNVIEPLQDKALFGPLAALVHHTRGANTAVILGRTVWLIGANDAKAEGKIQGLTACLAYVDEATLIPQGFWTMLLSRLSVPGARLLATTNPNGPAHWLRKDYLQRVGELNLAHWHFTLDDNPALDLDYVANLKAEYVGLWYRRYILGEWCLAEGAVYDMWDPARHVVPLLPRIDRWLGVGVDYGTTNPTAALLLGLGAPEDNGRQRLYLTREWRHDSRTARRSLTDVELSAGMRTWLHDLPVPGTEQLTGVAPEYWVVDPSAASLRLQLYRDGVTPRLADNAVLDRIRLVSSLLGADALRVHESCTGWINEIPGYSWDPKAAEKGEDEPIGVDNHSLDAGGYVINTLESMWRPSVALAAAA